jgi:hypothetical protein
MAALIMGVLLLLAVLVLVLFYRRSVTPEWGTSETRKAVLNVLLAVGPVLGMYYKRPRPPVPTIMAPGPEQEPLPIAGSSTPPGEELPAKVDEDLRLDR